MTKIEGFSDFKTHCFNYTDFEAGLFFNYSYDPSSKPVIFAPINFFPDVSYWRVQDDHGQTVHQWCGSMIMLANYYAKFTRSRVRLISPRPYMSTIDAYHVLLYVISAPYLGNIVYSKIPGVTKPLHSTFLGYIDTARVLAKIRKENKSLFHHFDCFEPEIYYMILISITTIAIVIGFMKRSLKTFSMVLWSNLSVMLNANCQVKVNSHLERLVTGLWFLVCGLLLSAFSGKLRDQLLKAEPIKVVDSWNDLYEWKGVTIECHIRNELCRFSEESQSEMARNFKSRLKSSSIDILQVNRTNGKIDESYLNITAIKNGDMVITYPNTMLQAIKHYLIADGLQEDIDFHIAKEADPPIAYYTLVTDPNILKNWNMVITISRESGIYSELQNRGLNPGHKPVFDMRIVLFTNDIQNIVLNNVKGIFLVYMVIIASSICILGVECIVWTMYSNVQQIQR